MSELVGRMQMRLKKSSGDLFTFFLRFVSGLVLSLTLALIIHEIMGKKDGESTLAFSFMIVAFTTVFMRVAKKWSLVSVLVFDLVCILIAIILKFYIMVAPGA
jgi:hypothetical protein